MFREVSLYILCALSLNECSTPLIAEPDQKHHAENSPGLVLVPKQVGTSRSRQAYWGLVGLGSLLHFCDVITGNAIATKDTWMHSGPSCLVE